MTTMNHGSLFSGIGGFDLAAQWMGWENIFHCEINPFGRKVLKYYWPTASCYDDITKTDFTIHRGHIDILTGGFPCQPFSVAGKRKGTEDNRNLWPEMYRAIREIQPTYVVAENVFGLLSWSNGMVFNQVQADLENEGYKVTPFVLPACGLNAPHRRERVWFVAHANIERCENSGGLHTKLHRQKTDNGYDGIDRNNNGWENFPKTQPTIRGRNDGLSWGLDGITFPKWRHESIKAFGNAIVPQVAYQIFKALRT